MRLALPEAVSFFHRLPPARQIPSLHPHYVQADAARSASLEPVFFMHARGGEFLFHAFHLQAVPGTAFSDVQSPYGYGGPVATTLDPEFLEEAWQAYSDWCAIENVLAEFVRFHPLIENWTFFNGDVVPDRETVWVDLKQADLLAGYQVRVRTAVRKAIRHGLTVEWWPAVRLSETFPDLYRATMEGLKASEFYFFPADYFKAFSAWTDVRYAVCLHAGRVVAAAMFLLGPEVMEYHLSASDPTGRRLGATNLLLHEAGRYGQEAGCTRLHLGGGTDPDPDNPLLFFKSGFSAHRASFRIGRKIHRPDAYAALKAQWIEQFGSVSSRVLFYRNA